VIRVVHRRFLAALLPLFEAFEQRLATRRDAEVDEQVVPPATPEAGPVKKSSAETVPMNGSSMWTCGSMKPGSTN
jgi:hypothetical protein